MFQRSREIERRIRAFAQPAVTYISRIEVHRLSLPLTVPYVLSYRTFTEFEPYVCVVTDDFGQQGLGEGHISPGSSRETREGGWAFVNGIAGHLLAMRCDEARNYVASRIDESPVAATSLMTALEMLTAPAELDIGEDIRLPLLAPVAGKTAAELESEIEDKLERGFQTFKVKVGKDVRRDLTRLGLIQNAVDGRASLRVDANRAFSRDKAIEFAAGLNPEDVELFEQPCDAEDWDANAAVAQRCPVPLMLDEPICSVPDIERAAEIENVGYLKVKLKRFGGLTRLHRALQAILDNGMQPVLGDGLGAEIACWMEACVARGLVHNAGEFNGYLKPTVRILTEPLGFENGALFMPAGYRPQLDPAAIDAYAIESVLFE